MVRTTETNPLAERAGGGATPGPGNNDSTPIIGGDNNDQPSIEEMDLDQMEEALASGQLDDEALETIRAQLERAEKARQLLGKIRGLKRRRPASDDEGSGDEHRRKVPDIKYRSIEKLRVTSSLREWTDWKADVRRKLSSAPRRFGTGQARITGALDEMDKDCRTRWNTHISEDPSKEGDWDYFLPWSRTLIIDNANFDTNMYKLHQRAVQKPGQTPIEFDNYLSSLEREMEPVSQSIRALQYFSKLQNDLRYQIQVSGHEKLPETRQGMVSLASRVWDAMQGSRTHRRPQGLDQSKPSTAASNANTSDKNPSQPSRQSGERGRGRGRGGRYGGTTRAPPSSSTNEDQHRRKEYRFPTGKNDKGEVVCFKCGSTAHRVANCTEKEKSSVKVQTLQAAQPASLEELSDSSENE